jgi:hypothetical protein
VLLCIDGEEQDCLLLAQHALPPTGSGAIEWGLSLEPGSASVACSIVIIGCLLRKVKR